MCELGRRASWTTHWSAWRKQSLPVRSSKRYGASNSSRLIASMDWVGRVAWRYELGAAHCCLTGVPMADAYVVIES
jgi:hypothetical protein